MEMLIAVPRRRPKSATLALGVLLAAGWAGCLSQAGAQTGDFKSAAHIAAQLQRGGPALAPPSQADRDAALLRGVLGSAPGDFDKGLRDVALPEPDGRCTGATPMPGQTSVQAAQRALAVVALGAAQQPRVDLHLRFATGGYALSVEDKRQLDELVQVLKGPLAQARVTIAGHTDRQGSAQLNLRLSCARGAAVLDYLIERGLPAERFGVYGFGAAQAGGLDDAASRRVEIRRADD